MAVDVESERGAVDVIVRRGNGEESRGHLPDKKPVMIQTAEQYGSNAHADEGSEGTSPPDKSRSGYPPMQDSSRGSSEAARNILDPLFARGSQASVGSRDEDSNESSSGAENSPHSSCVEEIRVGNRSGEEQCIGEIPYPLCDRVSKTNAPT